jgi:O-methyltransferase
MIFEFGRKIYHKFPRIRPFLGFFHRKFILKPKFVGWGMTTQHQLPWINEFDDDCFRKTCIDIKNNFKFTTNTADISKGNIDTLRWRHWIVSYCTRHVMKFTNCLKYNFVECGVGDGVTTFFSLREINNDEKIKENFSMHLYDSWSEMKKDNLLKEELLNVGRYLNLNIELTKSNLKEFEKKIIFHQGYIPESFSKVPNSPDEIVFLHIDLNSAIPTKATLDFFFPKITHGGIILFDDYGWEGYDETKQVVDKYFYNKSGMLLKLPTGQAIYFNN